MKYGAIFFKETANIGDDIQTYVALRFLPKLDYLVEREKLDSFVPEKDEKVKVICNGFFHHDKMNFPFSPYIEPLYTSMHFAVRDPEYHISFKHLNGFGLKDLKKHNVGCRDMDTVKLLKDRGVNSYFSGCMTTTLQKFDNIERGDYICAVDLKDELVAHIKTKTDSEIKEITHNLVPSENSKLDFDTRMKNVEDILKIYQGAKLVVTDRLHVALPCLALGTPVILVYYELNSDRLKTFKDYVYALTEDEFLNTDYDFNNPIPNNDKYLEFKNKLEESIQEFIKKPIEKNEFCDVDFYKENVVDKCNYHKDIAKDIYDELKNLVLEETDIKREWVYTLGDLKRILKERKDEFLKIKTENERIISSENNKIEDLVTNDLRELKILFEKLENSKGIKLTNKVSKKISNVNENIKEILEKY